MLIIAEAANPEWVSVPLVGWSIANALRRVADVHIVTQIRNREAIARTGWLEGRDFTCLDTEAVMKPLWRLATLLRGGEGKGWTIVTAIQSLSYPLFEMMIWRRFGKRIRERDFDVVHRVTPLSPTAPSRLAKLCRKAGVPFVLGPLNGGVSWPKGFDSERRKEREWLSYARSIYKLMPGIRETWSNASAIIVGSLHTQSELPSVAREKSVYIPENAIDPGRFTNSSFRDRYDRLSLCFIGRLVPYKGPDIALAAAAPMIVKGAATMTFVGDGPMMERLKGMATELGISDRVTFSGWVKHSDVPEITRNHSLFLFPSIREFGGGAVIEAMALGMVPLIVDYGGPGEIVTAKTGFKIPIGTKRAITDHARAKLEEIAANRHDLKQMAKDGRQRIEALYTWERKAQQISEVYEWVSGTRDRPRFSFLSN